MVGVTAGSWVRHNTGDVGVVLRSPAPATHGYMLVDVRRLGDPGPFDVVPSEPEWWHPQLVSVVLVAAGSAS